MLVSGLPIATWGTELYVDDVTLTPDPWVVRYSYGEGQTKILYCTHTMRSLALTRLLPALLLLHGAAGFTYIGCARARSSLSTLMTAEGE